MEHHTAPADDDCRARHVDGIGMLVAGVVEAVEQLDEPFDRESLGVVDGIASEHRPSNGCPLMHSATVLTGFGHALYARSRDAEAVEKWELISISVETASWKSSRN